MLFGAMKPRGLMGGRAMPVVGYGDGVAANGMGEPMASPTVGDAGPMAIGWDAGGTDTLPRLPAPTLPRSTGIFGSSRNSIPADTGDPRLPNAELVAATAMGALPQSPSQRRQFSEPFDYDAALASMLPQRKKPTTLGKIAEFALPALMALGDNQAGLNSYLANRTARRDADDQQTRSAMAAIARWKHDDWARQNGADLRASTPFTIGRDRLQYDPQTGDVATLYDGAEPFEAYAETMGFEPGSEDYFNAVEDYVLRGDGPTALDRKSALDDHRTANDRSLEAYRYGNRVGLEGIRQANRIMTRGTPTYRDRNPRPARGGARPTATGPNGQKMEFDGQNWVPVK